MKDIPSDDPSPGAPREHSGPSFRSTCAIVAAIVLLLVSLLGMLGIIRL
jgi:hypothetical protein